MGRSQSKTVYQVFLSATLIAFLILALRLLFVILPAAKRKTYQDPVVSPRVVRGTIIDRNGRILAIETPYSSLYFHLSKIKDMDGLATLLSPYLGMSVDEIKAQAGKYTTYALIKKEIDPTQLEALRKVITSEGLDPAGIGGKPYRTHLSGKLPRFPAGRIRRQPEQWFGRN
ncbi:MAG: hypothetical protein LKE28_10185 [Sphaerochaeta sp.]|nr:hypothetical protein [Sphaerochaeta sp.]